MQAIFGTRSSERVRRTLVATASGAALAAAFVAGPVWAADATATADTTTAPVSGGGAGAEGTEVTAIVVTAERGAAAAAAPTKASLDQTQPESIISHGYIEQVTPELGGWTTVLTVAPSVAGITSNGGGIGDYNVVSMRGFKDGQFNLTFDGIAFGDTNDPTHHGADYFPASTIGAAVVDRGPGAAGDLGQENYGGAIHFFTPDVSDTFGAVQKFTLGSFGAKASVTTLNTGAITQLGGAKLLLNFDERWADGELSGSSGYQYNQMFKFMLPLGDEAVLTLFGTHQYSFFHFEDSSGPGETWQQELLFGKNFSMNGDPKSEHFTGYNFERKRTDFEYADLKYQIEPTISLEDQLYTYWYSNKTKSTNDLTGDSGPDLNSLPGVKPVANTSPPNITAPPASATDVGGYDKLNEYRVYGDIIRINKDWSFGTLKVGGLVEGSRTFRHNCFIDFTLGGAPDNKFVPPKVATTTNCKLLEQSTWFQGQFFADFNWRVTDNLTISPGFKYVDFTRGVNATNENVGGGAKNQPLIATNNYASPLYFLTANYKIRPYWSVYAQAATSFLIPSLSALYVTGANLQNLKPTYTDNYQIGTVYTRGAVTADLDAYWINATNLEVACSVPDPTQVTGVSAAFCNVGKARYSGVEGEAAYAFDFGLSIFANGSVNDAEQLASPAPTGGAATLPMRLANAPGWTAAAGAIINHGPWEASLTYKRVGGWVDYNSIGANSFTFHLPGYDTLDLSAGYDFGHHVKVKLQVFNLLDTRAVSSFSPGGNTQSLFPAGGFAPLPPIGDGNPDQGIYTFQAGRQVEVTLIGKF
jgi:iron complex outermembrane receptor protein